jgi:hypothetical protein
METRNLIQMYSKASRERGVPTMLTLADHLPKIITPVAEPE